MQAGDFNRRITIEQLSASADSYGADGGSSWSTLAADVPAHVRPISAVERVRAGREVATEALRFVLRYRSDLTANGHRIVYESKRYDITGIAEYGPRRQFLEVSGELAE